MYNCFNSWLWRCDSSKFILNCDYFMCSNLRYFLDNLGLINIGYIVNEIGRILSKMN